MLNHAWRNFSEGIWKDKIDVRDFIVRNYTPYGGDENFLSNPSSRTESLWGKSKELLKDESKKGGVLEIDTESILNITSFSAGYVDRELELIKGFQTDKPLKRGVVPYGGIKTAKTACEKYGYELSHEILETFEKYRKTHNSGVFNVYTPEMKKVRKCGIITGLPDSYGRGRIIGDYRRVALYGVKKLIQEKLNDLKKMDYQFMNENVIKLREEIQEQITSLNQSLKMAATYDCDISNPAKNAIEAFQWTYFAFLAAVKENNGAANSLGRVSTFLDIYIERDIREGILSEEEAQELVDQFIIKLRFIRHLRTPEYNELFAGDPVWITEAIGGMCSDGRHMVTKNSFRFLQTLYNLGASPEPNLTILWSKNLPESFKGFCSRVSIDTSTLQYENDDIMQPLFGDDYGISCCVSAMSIGKDMQYFGARCNLPKLLLISLNAGKDEITGDQVAPQSTPYKEEYLEYDIVMEKFNEYLDWLTQLYVSTMNVIHFMHDKYAYERIMMALHDSEVNRFMAFGIAGFSVLVDSLSAIKHSRVKVVRDNNGLITDFETTGDYPQFGNDDERVDSIGVEITKVFYDKLKKFEAYRNATHTLSILTITSNVVYGHKTGSTPDGRKKGSPFAPGANPMHGRDKSGALSVLNSVAKLPYQYSLDGISFTLSLVPKSLGKDAQSRVQNLAGILDGYFNQGGHQVNINILDKETLEKAMEDPEFLPNLTIRVSGYAVNFHKLSHEHQLEVVSRTFHNTL